MECILVYRDLLSPLSETFIYRQLHLRHFIPVVLGSETVQPSIDLVGIDFKAIRAKKDFPGLMNEMAFKMVGYLPKPIHMWLAERRPRLVHAHFGPDGAMVLPLAKRLDLPLIVSFHGSDATLDFAYARRFRHYWLYQYRRRQLIAYCSVVLVPSHFVLQQLVTRHGFPEAKITILPHAVNPELFSMSTSPEPGRILFVGRLVRVKGLHLLIDALAHMKDSVEYRLIVVGDGPERWRYQRMAYELLGDRVNFLGALPFQAVTREYQRAWIFCMPSYTQPTGETEAFGLVFAEAQAAGVPVVAFATGGVPEVVEHGVTGLLAVEGNVQELADYLQALLKDERLRYRMSTAARARAAELFSQERQIEQLESIYTNLL